MLSIAYQLTGVEHFQGHMIQSGQWRQWIYWRLQAFQHASEKIAYKDII
jgi:hypothetical protein